MTEREAKQMAVEKQTRRRFCTEACRRVGLATIGGASGRGARGGLWKLAAIALMLVAGAETVAADGPSWRVKGEVHVNCPMTVGGSFEARAPSLTGTVSLVAFHPAALAGQLTVDLSSLDTGIGLRNRHLRDQYLEVTKGEGFDKAVLSEIRLPDVDAPTFQGRTGFTGTFLLHGTKQAIEGQAEIRRQGSAVVVEASFPLTLSDYGIQKPQYLGVGVRSVVRVKVSLVATPESPERASEEAR